MRIIYFLIIVTSYSYSQTKNKNKNLQSELTSILDLDQKYRKLILNENNFTKKEIDSLWDLQYKLDNQNIDKSIEIIKENGYLNAFNSKYKSPFMTVFMHTHKDKIEEVKKLIIDEKNKDNIDEASYGIIMWHLEGRKINKSSINFRKPNDTLNKQ